ncbi:hypothetical protein F4777DRAFT_463194 [Nemania sp. FL0916]|nr:hypothetical protein F4777DRAFT_463194 [Nemania sp. FL0916]
MPMSSSGHDDDSPETPAKNPTGSGPGPGIAASARRVKKKRVRVFTEDDRAAHRIFEKSRREAFKEALTNLASLLPALADTEPQRLSKHVVVDESIAFIRSQHEQIRSTAGHLEAVKTERDDLLAELNHWRGRAGMALRQATTLSPSEAMLGVGVGVGVGAVASGLPLADGLPVLGEAPTFLTNALHEPARPALSAASDAPVHWDSYEPQMRAFAENHNHSHNHNHNHAQAADGPENINIDIDNSEPPPLSTYQNQNQAQTQAQTPQAQAPAIAHFAMDRGQHGNVFLPFDAPPFSPGGFQADAFVPNTAPLHDYMPP